MQSGRMKSARPPDYAPGPQIGTRTAENGRKTVVAVAFGSKNTQTRVAYKCEYAVLILI
jgi:hypothetical protein